MNWKLWKKSALISDCENFPDQTKIGSPVASGSRRNRRGRPLAKTPGVSKRMCFEKLLQVKLEVKMVIYPNETNKIFLLMTKKKRFIFFDWEKWICWDMNWEARV